MLFSCGFGVSIVFWGVAEPMTHFGTPPQGLADPGSAKAARTAMQYAFFDNGIHQWASFTIVGLALSYFRYRKKGKALISETLNPLIGNKGKKPLRKAIDILAVIATVVGVATSLGLGILQINGGLNDAFSIPQNTGVELLITGVILILYLASATTGLNKGIKYLSNLNLSLALFLMLVVLILGPTIFDLQALVMGIGDYIQHFFEMSLQLEPYSGGTWVKQWPIFFWAWTIAWSPFVGMFIARISKGRTIRQLIIGVMVVPPFIGIIWIAIFGGAAIHMDLFQGTDIAGAVQNDVTSALFVTLDKFPFSMVLTILSIILIFTFLITSADSATFVLGIMTTDGHMNPSTLVKVIWGVLMSAIAGVLIISSGLQGVQTASLITALPFAVILIAICFSLLKSLRHDHAASAEKSVDVETKAPKLDKTDELNKDRNISG